MKLNKIIMLILAAILCMSLFTGCFSKGMEPDASDVTVKDLIDATNEYFMNANTVSESIELKMDISMAFMGQKMQMGMEALIKADVEKDLRTHIASTMNVSSNGQTKDVEIEAYTEKESDGSITVYTKENSTWSKTVLGVGEMERLMDLDSVLNEKFIDQLKVTGTEDGCYKVEGDLPGDVLMEIMSSAGGSENLDSMIPGVDFSEVKFPVKYLFDTETKAMVSCTFDARKTFEELMKKALEEELGGTTAGIEMTIDSFEVKVIIDGINQIDSIIIPDEVKSSAGTVLPEETTPELETETETQVIESSEGTTEETTEAETTEEVTSAPATVEETTTEYVETTEEGEPEGMPFMVWDNSYSIISVNGKQASLPGTLGELASIGFDIGDSANETIEAQDSISTTIKFGGEGNTVSLTNHTDKAVPASEATIFYLEVDIASMSGVDFKLGGFDTSDSVQDLIDVLGSCSYVIEGDGESGYCWFDDTLNRQLVFVYDDAKGIMTRCSVTVK